MNRYRTQARVRLLDNVTQVRCHSINHDFARTDAHDDAYHPIESRDLVRKATVEQEESSRGNRLPADAPHNSSGRCFRHFIHISSSPQ